MEAFLVIITDCILLVIYLICAYFITIKTEALVLNEEGISADQMLIKGLVMFSYGIYYTASLGTVGFGFMLEDSILYPLSFLLLFLALIWVPLGKLVFVPLLRARIYKEMTGESLKRTLFACYFSGFCSTVVKVLLFLAISQVASKVTGYIDGLFPYQA